MTTSSRARYLSILANTLNSSGKITSNNLLLPDSGVVAGTYGSASQVPIITLDSKGRVTSASVTSVAGVSSFSYNISTARLTINTADGGTFNADITLAPFSTTNLTEGTNQYFTTARARSSISATGTNLSYNSTTGVLSYTQGNTDTVAEGATNLYYTNARARGALSYTPGSASYNSTSGQITIPSTTSHITESGNLYYTDARVRAALAAGTGVTYNSSTGTFSIGQPVATTDNVTFANVTATGNLTVNGNLTVSGTTTTVNSTTVSVADINIEVARNATTAAQANGAGLTVTGPVTPATLTYSSGDDRWNLNKDLNINRVFGNVTGALTGNASTATTLQTTRSFTITGDAAWTVNFDGSANASGALTLSNSGVTAGSYGSGTAIPVLTIDSKGRVTAATTSAVTIGDGTLTVSAGAGLTGSGTFTANQTTNNTITISHADTSSVANLSSDNAGNTFIQDLSLTFDTYGHVTGATVATGTVSVGDGAMTVTAGAGLTGGGQLGTANQAGASSVTISHADTSSVGNLSSDNSNGVVLQDIAFTYDTYGHVQTSTVSTIDLDGRYYTETEADNRFVNVTGDTMTGVLDINTTPAAPSGGVSLTLGSGVGYRYIQSWNSQPLNLNPIGNAVQVAGNTVWHAGNLTNLNQLINGPGYITGESDTLATVTARGNSTSTNIGSTSGTALALATAGNVGTWIGGIQDGTSGWSLSQATIGFKSDNNTYAAIGIATAQGLLYFGRTTAAGVGSMSSWLEVNSNGVANFVRARPQHNGSNLALVSEIPSLSGYLTSESDTLATVTARGSSHSATITWSGSAGSRAINYAANDGYASMRVIQNAQASGVNADGMYIGYQNGNSGITRIFGGGAGSGALEKRSDHSLEPGSFRSPIFYDQNDTSYYVDANSGSRLAHLYVGNVDSSNTGSWNARLNVAGSSHARLDVISNSDGIITTMYSHTGQGVGRMGTMSNHPLVLMAQSGNDGGYVYNGSLRSPIFYDSQNTAYFTDPASRSRQSSIDFGDGGYYIHGGDWGMRNSTPFGWIQFGPANSSHAHIYTDRSNFYFNAQLIVNGGSNINTGDIRANIFYDNQDTNYYLDPNSTSSLWRPTAATHERWSAPWRAMDDGNYRPNQTSDQNYWTNTQGWSTNYGNWDAAWKYGYAGLDIWGSSTGHPQGSGYVHAQGINSGMHYATSDGSSAYGWQMVGAADADSRWWLRGKWGSTTRPWYEITLMDKWIGNVLLQAGGAIYGTIFYDSNDSAYYIDPNSMSRTVAIAVENRVHITESRFLYMGGTATSENSWGSRDYTSGGHRYFNARSFTFNNFGYGSTYSFVIDTSGNATASGNVTAYSDERLKKDWTPISHNFINELAKIKAGTYTRIDNNERQAGSSAQDWLQLLPEVVVVSNDEQGTLSLAYGNAALVSAIELAKKVVEQEDRIAKLEALVETLINKLGEK